MNEHISNEFKPLFEGSGELHCKEVILKLPMDPSVYANGVVVDNPTKDSKYSATYRNSYRPLHLVSCILKDLDTYHKLFKNAVKLYSSSPCLGYREFDYESKTSGKEFISLNYDQVNTRSRNLGAGLMHTLLTSSFKNPQLSSHKKIINHKRDWKSYGAPNKTNWEEQCSFIVSIFSSNRMEWILTDLACSSLSLTNTALYDTLGLNVTKHILDATESPVVFCSSDKIELLLDFKREHPEQMQNLIVIISFDPITTTQIEKSKKLGIDLYDLGTIESIGERFPVEELPPTPDTLYTISFTSGTTGAMPKGVMLTQQNFAAATSFSISSTPHAKGTGKEFLFLPLTHIYEREKFGSSLACGYYLGCPQLTIGKKVNALENLIDDLKIFQPTYISLVPRILTKMESMIKSAVEESENAVKLKEIINYKLEQQKLYDGNKCLHEEYDNFVPYKQLRSLFGFEKLILTQTASAPISPSTVSYLRAALNIGVRQMYGLTESFGAITASGLYDSVPGACGSIGFQCEIKLQSVESMGYSSKDNKGELMMRGPQMFKGYYKNKEETLKCLSADEWFSTGDVAWIDDLGRLHIIDRVKNFFKTAHGEYVSPEKVENRYLATNPILTQMFVYGDSYKYFLVAILGIDYDNGLNFLRKYCNFSVSNPTPEEVVSTLNQIPYKKRLLELLNSNVKTNLNGIEKIQNFHVDTNPLTVERDVVTPTLKIKRGVASKYFGSIFSNLYDNEGSLMDAKSKL